MTAPVAYNTPDELTLNAALEEDCDPTQILKSSVALNLTIDPSVPVTSPKVITPELSILVLDDDRPVVASVHPPTIHETAYICPVACCKANVRPFVFPGTVSLFILEELYANIPSLLNLTLAPDVGFAPA